MGMERVDPSMVRVAHKSRVSTHCVIAFYRLHLEERTQNAPSGCQVYQFRYWKEAWMGIWLIVHLLPSSDYNCAYQLCTYTYIGLISLSSSLIFNSQSWRYIPLWHVRTHVPIHIFVLLSSSYMQSFSLFFIPICKYMDKWIINFRVFLNFVAVLLLF